MLAFALLACKSPEPTPAVDPVAAVDAARYQTDLEALAVPRSPGTPGWMDARDRCRAAFEDLGLQTELHDYATGTNVIGRLPGTAPSSGAIVVSAHYDSVPDCTGADDNASGVAGVLEAARALSVGTYAEDIVFACWDEEERGLIGSRAWVATDEPVQLAFSLEMIGYRSDASGSQQLPFGFDVAFPEQASDVAANDDRGDFVAFVADVGATGAGEAFATQMSDPRAILLLLEEEQLLNPLFADLARSDHAAFWESGTSAVMVTDTANFRNTAYHCADGEDSVDRLDREFATAIVRGVVAAVASLASP